MAKKLIRLLARCQLHGAIREPGYTFEAPQFATEDEWVDYLLNLPHTVVDHGNPHAANVRADLHANSIDAGMDEAFNGRVAAMTRDVPLFEVIEVQDPAAEGEAPTAPLIADAATGELSVAPTGGEQVASQAESDEQQEPVEPAEEAESAEAAPAAEGEAHVDGTGDAPQV